jgi:glycosyltransferase involved in cell wall biosynthesis
MTSDSAAVTDRLPEHQGSSPLKILFCTWNYYPAPAGGAERQARLQAEELVRRGHRVTVMCPQMPGFGSAEINGVRVARLRRLYKRRGQRISYLASILLFVARRLRRFDVVHIHLANLQTDVIVPLAQLFRVPVYAKVACGGEAGEVYRLRVPAMITRWYGLRHATRVQALSQEIVDELASIGVRRDRIVRVPNGLDLLGFAPVDADERQRLRAELELPADSVLFLFVGRFAQYKGIEDLLAAWSAADLENAHLVLVGSATETDKPIGEFETPETVIVRDYTNSIVEYLGAADAFVYPSYTDGMSNAVLEALACGLPVVASRSGATEELIDDGKSGVLFDAGNRSALADAIQALHGDHSLRSRLGVAARAAVEPYDIRTVVDRIETEYRQLTQGLS